MEKGKASIAKIMISVIIPVINEAEGIASLIEYVKKLLYMILN